MSRAETESRAGEAKPVDASQNFPKLPIGEKPSRVIEHPPAPPSPPSPPTSASSASSPSPSTSSPPSSSPLSPPADGQLTAPQLVAIEIMLAGRPLRDVAAGAGVTRRTLYTWRHHHAAFRAELERRRADLWDETADRLRALLDPACRALEEQLRAVYRPDRYRAARTILRLARVGSAIRVKQPEEEERGGDAAANDSTTA